METVVVEKADIEFYRVSSPANPKTAWQIESLLLRIFEYGDYSFRSALSGRYCDELNCVFFIDKNNGAVIAAAGSLYARRNPAICILGPVCVDIPFRRKGLATELCGLLLLHLKTQGCQAIYLGVGQDGPAAGLYKKLGFERYKGIVMRKLFCSEGQFSDRFSACKQIKIRRMSWVDYPAVSALMCEPAAIYTFDFYGGIYSARYVEPQKYLQVFPEMMKSFEKYGGFANVLLSGNDRSLAGIAHISGLSSPAQRHIAVLDFFVHDNFINQAAALVSETIHQFSCLSVQRVISYCPACDQKKQSILKSLGAKTIAVLPQYVCINNQCTDVFVYGM